MYQLRSDEGRIEEVSDFGKALEMLEAGGVYPDDPESTEVWNKLSWNVEGGRVRLFADGTWSVITKDALEVDLTGNRIW